MKKQVFALLALLFAASIFSLTAYAALPIELTADSSMAETWSLLDKSRYTKRSFAKGDALFLQSEEEIAALYLVFDPPAPSETDIKTETGEAIKTHGYLHDYIELSAPAKSLTIAFSQGAVLCDVYAFSQNEPLPDFVQVWQPNTAECDVLFLPTHADDEHLYFGGLLAISAAKENCETQVAYMVNHNGEYYRPHELLNGLWAVGVRRYPIIPEFPDIYCGSLEYAKTVYSEEEILSYQVALINALHPNIIIGHDLNGEYGHGAHILNAVTLTQAVEEAAKAPNGWNTPKTYLHLYPQNEIIADFSVPIAAMQGKTALELAIEGFACHKSQQEFFKVEDFGPYDCRKFGLYRTAVGSDSQNDIFENITTHAEAKAIAETEARQARLEKEKLEAEQKAQQAAAAAADKQKEAILPQAQNDFVFAVVGSKTAAAALAITAALCLALIVILLAKRHKKRKKR